MKTRIKLILMIIAGICSAVWLAIVKTVDVGIVGPRDCKVGLSLINSSFHDLWHYDDALKYNKLWYNVTQYLGYLALGCAAILGLIGLVQLIKRKNLWKVDKCIIAAGVLYIITIGLYVFFELVVINYRPIIMPDDTEPAASFPSSHTMLVIVVLGSIMILLKNYVKKTVVRMSLQFLCLIVIVTMVLGRFICGVHWFSDIIGGMLLGMFLLAGYSIFSRNTDISPNANVKIK